MSLEENYRNRAAPIFRTIYAIKEESQLCFSLVSLCTNLLVAPWLVNTRPLTLTPSQTMATW